jgi:hypothetical protein
VDELWWIWPTVLHTLLSVTTIGKLTITPCIDYCDWTYIVHVAGKHVSVSGRHGNWPTLVIFHAVSQSMVEGVRMKQDYAKWHIVHCGTSWRFGEVARQCSILLAEHDTSDWFNGYMHAFCRMLPIAGSFIAKHGSYWRDWGTRRFGCMVRNRIVSQIGLWWANPASDSIWEEIQGTASLVLLDRRLMLRWSSPTAFDSFWRNYYFEYVGEFQRDVKIVIHQLILTRHWRLDGMIWRWWPTVFSTFEFKESCCLRDVALKLLGGWSVLVYVLGLVQDYEMNYIQSIWGSEVPKPCCHDIW